MPNFSPIVPWPILLVIFAAYLWTLWALWRQEKGERPLHLIFRLIATLLIFFCALKPAWKVSQTISSKQTIYILIDSSQSMKVKDELPSRYKNALSLLKQHQDHIDKLDRVNVEVRFFDLKLHETEPKNYGSASSISNALASCLQEDSKIRAFMILSDGIQNYGQDLEKVIYSIKQNESQVYFVPFGKEQLRGEFSDVSLSQLRSPEFIQEKQELKIKFKTEIKGLKGQTQSFELSHEGRILATHSLIPKTNHQIEEIEMIVPAKKLKPSYNLLEIKAQSRENEITPLDNQAKRLVFVREEGLKILLLATAPSADYKFLRRSIESNPHFTLSSPSPFLLQSSKAAEFWTSTSIEDFDLIILCRPNPKSLPPSFFKKIYELYSLNKKGLLIFNGKDFNTYLTQDLNFADSLPSTPLGPQIEQEINFEKMDQNHFITKNLKDIPLNDFSLAGISYPNRPNPGSRVILQSQSHPLIMTRNWKESRLGIIQTNALWQLNLNKKAELYHELMTRLVYFLCAREDDLKDQLNVKSNKLNYSQEEKIFFTANLKNEEGEKIKDAQISLTLADKLHLMSAQALSYSYESVLDQNGLIEFRAKSKVKDEILESLPAKLYIQSEYHELKDITPNTKLLKALSEKTQGSEVERNKFSNWLTKMNQSGRVNSVSLQVKKTPLWDNFYVLSLIILFFCLEWYWRKFR